MVCGKRSEAPAVVASLHLQSPEKDFALILSKLLLLEYRLCHGEMRVVRAFGVCAGGSRGWAQLKGLEAVPGTDLRPCLW